MDRSDEKIKESEQRFQQDLESDIRYELNHSIKEHMFDGGGKTFTEYLQNLIAKKGMKNVEVYTRANLTKQYFSKLMNERVHPTKNKLLCLAVALRLDLDDTNQFLNMGGYALSPYNKTDWVFRYYIGRNIFDIFRIDDALYDLGLPSLLD